MVNNWSGMVAQLNCNISLDEIVRRSGIPTLSDVSKVYGNATSVEVITEHLKSVLCYAGVELSPEQLAETSLSILSSYYFLNLAELCVFFVQLKNGSRGQFVWGSRVNNQAIMVALHDFCEDRNMALIRLEKAKVNKATEKNFSTIDDAAAAMIKGIDEFSKLKEEAKNDYYAFRRLFPQLPNNYKPEDLFNAYSGKEIAIRTLFRGKEVSAEEASDRICKYLIDYNVKFKNNTNH